MSGLGDLRHLIVRVSHQDCIALIPAICGLLDVILEDFLCVGLLLVGADSFGGLVGLLGGLMVGGEMRDCDLLLL